MFRVDIQCFQESPKVLEFKIGKNKKKKKKKIIVIPHCAILQKKKDIRKT